MFSEARPVWPDKAPSQDEDLFLVLLFTRFLVENRTSTDVMTFFLETHEGARNGLLPWVPRWLSVTLLVALN